MLKHSRRSSPLPSVQQSPRLPARAVRFGIVASLAGLLGLPLAGSSPPHALALSPAHAPSPLLSRLSDRHHDDRHHDDDDNCTALVIQCFVLQPQECPPTRVVQVLVPVTRVVTVTKIVKVFVPVPVVVTATPSAGLPPVVVTATPTPPLMIVTATSTAQAGIVRIVAPPVVVVTATPTPTPSNPFFAPMF